MYKSIIVLLLSSFSAYAAEIIPNATNTFFDANGDPLASGYVYMYVPGTTTPKNTWQDSNLTTINTNPIILDSSGQARIWAGNGESFRQVVQDQDGNLMWDAITSSSGQLTPGGQPVTPNEIASFADSTGTVLKEGGPASISGPYGIFLFDPTQATQQQFKYTGTASGTVTSTPTDQANAALLWYKQTGALIGSGVNTGIALAEFDYDDTGTTINNDSFIGLAGNCNLLGLRANAGISGGTLAAACVGGVMAARGLQFQGGDLGSNEPQGEIHGLNVVAGVSNIPPFTTVIPSDYVDHEGIEVDMVGCSGCTVHYRVGFYSVDFGDGSGGGAEQGTATDAAFAVGAVSGTGGFRYGIDFVGNPMATGNALSGDGTVLGSSAATPTIAANGIDLYNFAFTDYAFRGPNGTFLVTNAGDTAGQSITAQGGFISNYNNTGNAVIEFRDTNVAIWDVGREAVTDDFIVKNMGGGGSVRMRIDNATGITSIGHTNAISIKDAGGLLVPGVSTSIGSITGSVCMDVNHELIYKVGANCI